LAGIALSADPAEDYAGRMGATIDELKHEQAARFTAEDFPRYFAACARLAAADPGYAASHEVWLHRVLHRLGRDRADVAVLQIGAMDGKRFDPVYAFIKHYRWRAWILEPLPDLFAALAAHYAGHDHATPVPAALLPRDGVATMHRVPREAVASGAVPDWAEGLGSFRPERNALGGVGVGIGSAIHTALGRHATEEPVDGLTLATLAERYGIARIDLLQVDAEGCELDILQQIDRHGFRPRVIHLEHWALPLHERGALLGLLGERGYSLRMSESDVLGIDPDLKQALDAESGWST
jgi:FkbM family methyltransferase